MHGSRARVRRRPRQAAGLVLVLCLTGLPVACGKKGPPLAPLVRIPEPVRELAARRVDADVYLRLRVPSKNRDGSTPADIVRVELFALTADAAPSAETVQQMGTRIASVPVVAASESAPESAAAKARQTGVKPGDEVVVRDTVTAGAPGRRYYMAFAFSGRGRASAPGLQLSVTAAPPPPPPTDLVLKHTPSAAILTWSGASAGDAYDVYRDTREPVPTPAAAAGGPQPINPTPLKATTFSEPYTYGEERCLHVRTRRTDASGETVESAASATRCHTPQDEFPPAPPADLQALPGAGEITLIWAPNTEPDIAGYLVLRGRAGDDTLAEITTSPVTGTRYVDRPLMPGVRYVYAVIAVDTRAPVANRSAESARDEAAAR